MTGLGLAIVWIGLGLAVVTMLTLLVIGRPRTPNDPGPDAEPERHPGNPEERP